MILLIFKTSTTETFSYPALPRDFKAIYENSQESIRIRAMSLTELVETRTNWLVPEGWPGIKYTLAATIANDPDGFYFLEKDGQKIASISVVTYPEINFAYIGFYLVEKHFRGKGYGKFLINKAMEYAATSRSITSFGLNCVESAVPMYQKYGFKIATVDEFWKYTVAAEYATANHPNNTATEVIELSIIDDNLFADLIEFDASIFGAHRADFLSNFLSKPSTITIISQENGRIQGYGVISEREPAIAEAHRSYKLGPLYANITEIADALLEQLIAIAKPEESIFLETPGNNTAAAAVIKQLGFEKIGVQPKMFKGMVPNFDVQRMFCYSSIAIGG